MKKFVISSLGLVIAAFALISSAAIASTLETKNFRVKITINCEEGVVGCDRVSYRGTDKTTGKSIRLSGRQIMRFCANGVTPCQSIGYEFKNGDYVYFVGEDGRLTVHQGTRLILNESPVYYLETWGDGHQ